MDDEVLTKHSTFVVKMDKWGKTNITYTPLRKDGTGVSFPDYSSVDLVKVDGYLLSGLRRRIFTFLGNDGLYHVVPDADYTQSFVSRFLPYEKALEYGFIENKELE